MARRPSETLTGREAEVMDAVWQLGVATAEQVRAALPEPLHDSTVRTLLRILGTKGYLATRPGARPTCTRRRSAGKKPSATRCGAFCAVLRRIGRRPGLEADRG